MLPQHLNQNPSPWIARFAHLVQPGGRVLDLACGAGRHARFFCARGHPVTLIDIDLSGVADLRADQAMEMLAADLESQPWPMPGRRFAAVVVANYLWRPILPCVVAAVAPGGVLLYETFAVGNEAYGRPRNPDFLLRPGELVEAVRGHLDIHAYYCGMVEKPRRAVVQRLAAVRPH